MTRSPFDDLDINDKSAPAKLDEYESSLDDMIFQPKTPYEADEGEDDWLDEWKVASGEPLKLLLGFIVARIADHEKDTGSRRRARKPADQKRFDQVTDCLVSNLAYAALGGTEK